MAEKRKDNRGKKVLEKGYSQYKDGLYCYRYRLDGKTKAIYDRDLDKLKRKVAKLNKDMEDGINFNAAERMTLNAMFDKYIEGKKRIRESTRMNYTYLYDRFVRDGLGERKLAKIRFSDLQNLYNDLLEDTLTIGTLKILHNALHPAFDLAVRDQIIRTNPTDGLLREIANTHETKQEKKFAMTQQEQAAFLAWARKSPDYCLYVPMFITFLGTGLRVGELLGLTWGDIDLKNGVIHVNKTLAYKVWEDGKAAFKIHPTKTGAGTRDIPILTEVRNALLEQKKERLRCGMCETVIDGYKDFVFSNSRNHVHKPNTINRVIDSIIKWANKEEEENAKAEGREPMLIRHFSVHCFRHTFATFLCRHESNLKTIQEIMGHSSIKVTMDVYAEATEEAKTESFKSLDAKFRIG